MGLEYPVAGLMVAGYRSFYTEPQFIGPFSRITVLAGPNNGGKSNVIAAAADWLPRLASQSPEGLPSGADRPKMPPGSEQPRFQIGVAFEPPGGDAAESLRMVLAALGRHISDEVLGLLHQVANAAALRPNGPDLIWLRFAEHEGVLVHDPQQLQAIANELTQPGVLPRLSGVADTKTSSVQHLRMILDEWRASIRIPHAVLVPPVRSVTVGTASAVDDFLQEGKFPLDGTGLPRVLQALHQPHAHSWLEHATKFDRLNRFVRLVLDDRHAEIRVPYDASTVLVKLGDPERREDRILELERLGQGIAQIVLIAAIATWYENKLLCIEEPETNLHPIHLRRLLTFLESHTSNQYLLSSHSPQMLDSSGTSVIKLAYTHREGTTIQTAVTQTDRAKLARDLGCRPSDLLQANCIIWVEGPSDRIYLKDWIRHRDPQLEEGVHYSVLCYGGALRAHLTADDIDEAEAIDGLISLPRINHHMAMVIDSDRASESDDMSADKKRIESGFREKGCICWITAGREIENYLRPDSFAAAVVRRHKTAAEKLSIPEDPFANYFSSDGMPSRVSKVSIAEYVVAEGRPDFSVLDLGERVDELVAFIRRSNDLRELS